MPLPEPRLDDRRFQDIVNEAKSLIPRYCPEWTDHNVSDPGVTMIELFAWMTDLLLYRLNRVPEKNYIRFMDLIGLRLQGATPARAPITFWLSAAQPGPVTIPRGTEVATVRTGEQAAITFSTNEDLTIVPPSVRLAWTSPDEQNFTDQTPKLDLASELFDAFQRRPQPGDALYLGFAENLSQHTLALNIDCRVEGIGVDPRDPPLVWEAWCGEVKTWVRAELERDETGGLNQAGTVVLHLPREMAVRTLSKQRAYWLRVRLVAVRPKQPPYSASPRINTIKATAIGGTAWATHSTLVRNEFLGRSAGTPGQVFRASNTPILARQDGEAVEVQNENGDWISWQEVESAAASGPNDRHYVLDSVSGEVQFGPAIRQPNGSERAYGATPPKGQQIRFGRYRFGGGLSGNVGANTLTVLKSSIPYVARVNNRAQAAGGLDQESLEAAKLRAPQMLRTRSRAVTAEDFEYLAREASQSVARARCIQARTDGSDAPPPGTVEVLIVPAVTGRVTPQTLQPPPELIEEVRRYLDERRLLGTNLVVDSPAYVGMAVEAVVVVHRHASADRVRAQVAERLGSYVDPLGGGPEGLGWPFGRDLYLSEVLTIIQSVAGVEYVQDATLYQVDLRTGQARAAGQRISLAQDALLLSYDHRITVKVGP
ncbi:MAG: putative baseplate assembly protein [Anaerolineales bacterium]|nr:putative baseplate assembly protein [Anaerolineales bacterium]